MVPVRIARPAPARPRPPTPPAKTACTAEEVLNRRAVGGAPRSRGKKNRGADMKGPRQHPRCACGSPPLAERDFEIVDAAGPVLSRTLPG